MSQLFHSTFCEYPLVFRIGLVDLWHSGVTKWIAVVVLWQLIIVTCTSIYYVERWLNCRILLKRTLKLTIQFINVICYYENGKTETTIGLHSSSFTKKCVFWAHRCVIPTWKHSCYTFERILEIDDTIMSEPLTYETTLKQKIGIEENTVEWILWRAAAVLSNVSTLKGTSFGNSSDRRIFLFN